MVRFCFILFIVMVSSFLSTADAKKIKKSLGIDSTSISIEVELDKDSVCQNDTIVFSVCITNTSDSLLVISVGGHTLQLQSARPGFGGEVIILDKRILMTKFNLLPMETKNLLCEVPVSELIYIKRNEYYVTYCSVMLQKRIRYFAASRKFLIVGKDGLKK